MRTYGVQTQAAMGSELEFHIEELAIQGFTIVKNVFGTEALQVMRERMDRALETQEREMNGIDLESIGERDQVRSLLTYDSSFLETAAHPRILEIAKAVLGDYFILHLQNGVINRPQSAHHQSAWHRDLPYQEFVSSSPLAIASLVCVDDFQPETGGTHLLPHSHRVVAMPSQNYVLKHTCIPNVEAGSAIVFDAMLFHRSGKNTSQKIRRGINNVYSRPLLKQQIDLPLALGKDFTQDPFLRRFLGYESHPAKSTQEWRANRLARQSVNQSQEKLSY